MVGLLTGFFAVTSLSGAEPGRRGRPGQPRVILFERPHFGGASIELELGAEVPYVRDLRFPDGGRVENRVSSVQIERGAQVKVYADDSFFGEYLELTRSVPDLAVLSRAGGQNWNNAISSLRIYESRPGGLRARDPSRIPRVIVFSHKNFRGEAFEIFPGERLDNLNHEHFESGRDLNDEISSIRVVGPLRLRLYYDKKFGGEYIDFSGDVEDLNRVHRANPKFDWNGKASSLTVEWMGPPQPIEPDRDDEGDDQRGDDRRPDQDRRDRP